MCVANTGKVVSINKENGQFKDIMKVDGVILTKMDGTAKGGIAVAITKELGVPVLYTGVGEGADDLMKFDPRAYAEGLFNE